MIVVRGEQLHGYKIILRMKQSHGYNSDSRKGKTVTRVSVTKSTSSSRYVAIAGALEQMSPSCIDRRHLG